MKMHRIMWLMILISPIMSNKTVNISTCVDCNKNITSSPLCVGNECNISSIYLRDYPFPPMPPIMCTGPDNPELNSTAGKIYCILILLMWIGIFLAVLYKKFGQYIHNLRSDNGHGDYQLSAV